MEESRFDAIAAGFFRAATGAIGWEAALLPVQQAFGARFAVLHTLQPSSGRLLALCGAGPDMQEALHAYERVRRMAAQAVAGHGLLQAFAYPMWLIDSERYIGFENDAAVAERERGSRVGSAAQRLLLVGDRADRDFGAQLQRLASAAHGTSTVVDLRRTRADRPVWLHLATVIPGAVLGAFGDRPQVVATLFDPMQSTALDPFALGEMFSLTPAEARVAARLAEGATVDTLAAEQGISVNTVRTHVRNLLHKFGVNRVTDVVRLLRQGEALWSAAGQRPR